jgi:hypothetical protein
MLELFQANCTRVHTKFWKQDIQLGISPKNPCAIIKYLDGIHNHVQKKVMPFKPRISDDAFVQPQYIVDENKVQPSGPQQKKHHGDSKQGWKKK